MAPNYSKLNLNFSLKICTYFILIACPPGSRVAVEAEDGVWRLGRVLSMRPGQMFSVRLDSTGQVMTVAVAGGQGNGVRVTGNGITAITDILS